MYPMYLSLIKYDPETWLTKTSLTFQLFNGWLLTHFDKNVDHSVTLITSQLFNGWLKFEVLKNASQYLKHYQYSNYWVVD